MSCCRFAVECTTLYRITEAEITVITVIMDKNETSPLMVSLNLILSVDRKTQLIFISKFGRKSFK